MFNRLKCVPPGWRRIRRKATVGYNMTRLRWEMKKGLVDSCNNVFELASNGQEMYNEQATKMHQKSNCLIAQ
jgi:hypothetical protein